uniref:Pancreatic progenitor cell differentiation and proliferation factor n=1 Tax=Monodelphis domestica TaxID=13616 RepID=A0A5F8H3I4_MONDO
MQQIPIAIKVYIIIRSLVATHDNSRRYLGSTSRESYCGSSEYFGEVIAYLPGLPKLDPSYWWANLFSGKLFPQDQPSKKKGGRVTIENFYGGKTQATEEKKDEIQTKSKHAPQNGNYP